MYIYIFKRLLTVFITLWFIITLTFFLMRMAPGNPFDGERPLPEAIKANMLKMYHMDEPLMNQYFYYLGNLLKGDLGPSYKMLDFSVNDIIISSFPVTLELTLLSILLALVIGVSAGIYAAMKQNTGVDYSIMSISMLGIVLPSYAIAPILTLIFSLWLHWFPVAGWYGGIYKILPVISLALPRISYIARLARGTMLDVLNSNYIRTAYAKGLNNNQVSFKHALKPTLLPIISYLGPTIAILMAGSVVVETIFDIPGLGRYFVTASIDRDYTLVMGIVIFYSFFVLFLSFLVDTLYAFIDPRVSRR